MAWSGLLRAGPTTPVQPEDGVAIPAEAVKVSVAEDTKERIVIDCELGDFTQSVVEISGKRYTQIGLGKEPLMKEVIGAPELPHVRRNVIIPNDAGMAVEVLASKYHDVADIDVPPSRGFISGKIDPAEVPYTFGEVYKTDAFYPGQVAVLRKPYILRDYRGVAVELQPFQYNPVTRILRVYTSVTVQVYKTRAGEVNVKNRPFRPDDVSLAFHEIYKNHFLNYGAESRHTPRGETGDLLVICHDSWMPNVLPLVEHNRAVRLLTKVVGVSRIGNDSASIMQYIRDMYNARDLAFVLLVGDTTHVAPATGSSDTPYTRLDGSDDYPEILVGRVSAESGVEVDRQILGDIKYEGMPGAN